MSIQLAEFLLMPLSAYLVGSFPSAFIWTRLQKNVAIHEIGTGNSGASNVFNKIGAVQGSLVFVLDSLVKGFLPTALLLRLDVSMWSFLLSSLSLVIGHNWSIFLRFKGGRGIATSIGVVLGAGLWWQMLILIVGPGLIGRGFIYKDSAPWTIFSLMILIILTLVYESQDYIIWLLLGLLILIVSKRVLTNDGVLFSRPGILYVLLLRIIFDRDVISKRDWINRDSL